MLQQRISLQRRSTSDSLESLAESISSKQGIDRRMTLTRGTTDDFKFQASKDRNHGSFASLVARVSSSLPSSILTANNLPSRSQLGDPSSSQSYVFDFLDFLPQLPFPTLADSLFPSSLLSSFPGSEPVQSSCSRDQERSSTNRHQGMASPSISS